LGFLAVKTQAIALQAQWIAQHFSRRTLWSPILQHIFGRLAGGPTSLVVGTKPKLKKIPRAWHSVFKAWYKLHPHWEADPATWTISEALSFPVSGTHSAAYPWNVPLAALMFVDSTTGLLSLGTDAQLQTAFACAAPKRVCAAVQALRSSSNSLAFALVQLLSSQTHPLPSSSPISAVFSHLFVADVSIRQLSTGTARRFLDRHAGAPAMVNWSSRAISRHGVPPADIWRRLWHAPTLPAHRQTLYRLYLNTLPIGHRIEHFANEEADVYCHFCPGVVQSLRHFVYACSLAHQIWQDFA
jgi:hypothetical protein